MTMMNRRELIAGAVALLGEAHLPLPLGAQQAGGAPDSFGLPVKPKNLLGSTFTAELLAQRLIAATAWHPYPKAEEREAWQAVPEDIGKAVVQRAEAVLGTEWASFPASVFLEYKRVGNRSHFEHYYFTRRQRLADLALGECVEGKGRFVDEIANGVWLTCEETFWGLPAHLSLQHAGLGSGLPLVEEPIVDLFAAETGATVAWIHYLLGKQLDQASPLITKRIEMEAKRRILDPALARDDFWWMFAGVAGTGHRLNNWTPWINSNWMATNLLLEQDPARRTSALMKMCKSLDQYLSDYLPDAGCEEGPGYWQVSPASYFDCCTLLTSATGGAGNVLGDPFVRKMNRYIADIHIADEYYVNYGDANPKEGPPAELVYRIGTAIGDKELAAFGASFTSLAAIKEGVNGGGQGRLSRSVPDILSAGKARSAEKADALARDSWYPALGLMTARVKAGSKEGFYLAVQAAPNLRSHAHFDSGSFIVFHDGEPVFVDVGPEAYTGPRYKWSAQSAFHNLPTVGGVMQRGGDVKYRASEIHYASDDAHAGVAMNLATAYPADAGMARWTRSIALDRKSDCIKLNEDFQLQRKEAVALSFMTSRLPTQSGQGSVVLSVPGGKVRDVSLKFDATQAVASIEKIDLKDEWLVSTWGATIYRVLLTSKQPVDSGKWAIEVV